MYPFKLFLYIIFHIHIFTLFVIPCIKIFMTFNTLYFYDNSTYFFNQNTYTI